MKTEELNLLLEKNIDVQTDVEVLKKVAKAWKEACHEIQKLYLSEMSDISEVTDTLKKKFPHGLSN